MSIITIGGIVSRKVMHSSRWNTSVALNIKLGHKLLGYLSFILAQVTVITGGIKYESKGHPVVKGSVIL